MMTSMNRICMSYGGLLLAVLLAVGGCTDKDAPGPVTATDSVQLDVSDLAGADDQRVPDSQEDALRDAPLPETSDAAEQPDDGMSDTDTLPLPPPLFASQTLAQVNLTFSDEAAATLESAGAEAVVNATLEVDGTVLYGVEVSRYGPDGTMSEVSAKPGFFLRLDPGNAGQQLDGYRSLILDNLAKDAGMVREHVLNLLFRESGVPAPQTKYAWLSVNGESVGLYLLMEPMSDPMFQAAWFNPNGILYWAQKDTDFNDNGVSKFVHRGGTDDDKTELKTLIESLNGMGDEGSFEALSQVIDMERYLSFAAVEAMAGVRRGYVHGKRNYAVYQDPTTQRWTLMPRELARASREGFDILGPKVRLHTLCLQDQACRFKLGDALMEVEKRLDELALVNTILLAKPFLLEMAALDERIEFTLVEVEQSIDRTVAFLSDQPDWVLLNLECLDPSTVDHDKDGFSGCQDDCNDLVATTHPGAPELCNLVDDDCNGLLDDAPDCPACEAFSLDNGDMFDLCFQKKAYVQAQEDCVARGGNLASIRNQSEQQQLVTASLGLWWSSWWIGLDDIEEEGTFVWQDGTPTDYTAWANNEPNDSNGEDCGHIANWAGGLWNDIPCKTEMPYICRYPTAEPPPTDVVEDAIETDAVDDAGIPENPEDAGPTEDLEEVSD